MLKKYRLIEVDDLLKVFIYVESVKYVQNLLVFSSI